MARRGGLGKGLGALIPPGTSLDSDTDTGGGLEELPTSAIKPNRFQPRGHFDEEALGALADSIREVGVLQPILVRPVDDGYELIAGERRWRAARRVGLQMIPALVRETDDATSVQHALVENLHRDDLNPLEEAAAYQQLIEDFGLTHEAVASQVGKSRASVTNSLRLLQLPPSIQKLVHESRLNMGQARALLGDARPRVPGAARPPRRRRTTSRSAPSRRPSASTTRRPRPPRRPRARPSRRRAAAALRPPGLLELEELLGDHLETRVTISMGSARGKVVIEFSTLEDLERIYRLMTDGAAARRDDVVVAKCNYSSGSAGSSTPRRMPTHDRARHVTAGGHEPAGRRRRRRARPARTAPPPCASRGARCGARPQTWASTSRTACELGAHRGRDPEAGLGAERARGVVASTGTRARRRGGRRRRGRRRSGWPPRPAPSRRRPTTRARRWRRPRPGPASGDRPAPRSPGATARNTRRPSMRCGPRRRMLALAHARDRALGQRADPQGADARQRVGGVGAEDAVAPEPGVALELARARRRCRGRRCRLPCRRRSRAC